MYEHVRSHLRTVPKGDKQLYRRRPRAQAPEGRPADASSLIVDRALARRTSMGSMKNGMQLGVDDSAERAEVDIQ